MDACMRGVAAGIGKGWTSGTLGTRAPVKICLLLMVRPGVLNWLDLGFFICKMELAARRILVSVLWWGKAENFRGTSEEQEPAVSWERV